MDSHHSKLYRQIAERDRRIARLNQKLAEKEAHIQALLNSWSWKITAPLRFLLKPLVRKENHLEEIGSLNDVDDPYAIWIEKNEPDKKEIEAQRKARFELEPLISIVTPVFNTPENFLREMIESVLGQTYGKWELCIADGASTEGRVKKILEEYAGRDRRIKVKFLTENRHIAGNSNEGLSLATGEFITFLDHDDTLAPFALFEVVKIINENHDVDFIYSDEDKITEDGLKRLDPFFKPDFSPDTLRSHNYIAHLTVIKKDLLDRTGPFREGYDGSQDYDLILRATEKANNIVHIPKVLYHWRISAGSAAGNAEQKMYAYESAKKALRDHLKRIGMDGEVKDGLFISSYKITCRIQDNPKVSIIIPNRDHADDLRRCVYSVLEKSTYRNFEIIIAENGSTEPETLALYEGLKKFENIRIVEWDKPFNFSSINNYAVKFSTGEILLFLNNDTEVISPDWLESMIEHAQRKEVGAVGAKLYYPDDTVQHGGVILGLDKVAGHSHKYFDRNSAGYFGRLKIIHNLSAVTGACLMMRKEVFDAVGGFDAGYPLAFGDIDICLEIRKGGYLVVFTPYAELYHHEYKTRGLDDTPEKMKRAEMEVARFKKKWLNILDHGDPYYSPNLTLAREDFTIKI